MNKKDCLGRLAEIKTQLDLLERQIAERVKDEESSEAAKMTRESKDMDRKLAQLELKDARERIRHYHVS